MSGSRLSICVFLLLLCGQFSVAEDWPQFRGPTGQGHTGFTFSPTAWSEKKGFTWKTALDGLGHSTPVILGDQIWLSTATVNGSKLGLLLIDRKTGTVLRKVPIFSPEYREDLHADNTYASPTPCIEKGRIYVDYGTYGVACVSTIDGTIQWQRDDFKIEHAGGPGSSPLLYGEMLLIHRDGADKQYIAALDKSTGEVFWQRNRTAPYRPDPVTHRAFSTPVLCQEKDRTVIISVAADQCHAIDPRNGDSLWHVRYTGFSNVPAPVCSENMVYICTGYYDHELLAVRLGGHGDVTDSHIAWRWKSNVTELSSPILVKDRLYFANEGGIVTCLNAVTGEKIAQRRLGGAFAASPIDIGGMLLFTNNEGTSKLLSVDDKLTVLHTCKLNSRVMSSPAAVDGELYIRTDTHLYRIENK